MYEAHFGLKEKPFSIIPDADFLYLSETHQQALTMLEYGVFEQSGITVITGDVGTGKTTLIRHLLGTIPYNKITVGLISNVHSSLGSLMQWVALALDIELEAGQQTNIHVFRRIQDYLIREYADGRRVVLIIDEAQNMEEDSLEELRMLMNINVDKNQLVQLVLVGQTELLDKLQQENTRQIAQRVTSEYHIDKLSLLETQNYIQERLQTAGATKNDIFSDYAIQLIYYFSGGVPRLINTLCDHSLALAYGSNERRIEPEFVLETVREKRIGGVNWASLSSSEAESVRKTILVDTGLDVAKIITESNSCT